MFSRYFLKSIVRTLQFRKKYKRSRAFIESVATEKIYQREDLIKDDFQGYKIIVGSDQVWNYNCSGNDTTFLLDWCETSKKYSYRQVLASLNCLKNKFHFLKNSFLNSVTYPFGKKQGRRFVKNNSAYRRKSF